MVGGVGKVKLLGTSSTASPGQPPDNRVVIGQNTRFTKQFRGYSSFDQGGYPMGENPFKIVVEVSGTYTLEIVRVYNDTYMEVKDHQVNIPDYIPFTLGTPRGRGALKYGPSGSEVILPNSQSREQLTIVCQKTYSASTVNDTDACKFTKELKVGYWLVLDKADPVVHRVITSIKSDYELTVDADFTLSSATATDDLTHSGTDLAAVGEWTWVACPPRIGKRATGMGTIETHADQTTDFKDSGVIQAGRALATGWLGRASGAATMKKHRLVGRGTRFETQFGAETHWAKMEPGAYYKEGPWMSVQLNGDWETVKIAALGSTGTYGEYISVLENSFSEPLLKATHYHWYTMLSKGTGRIRSYGKRVVSNAWSNIEFSSTAGEGTTEGLYGNTRFLTQLRTGFTITACGQTRMVNSIQSDVELTIDRPFTLGNREFIAASGSTARADDMYVRGLTRLMPLWPRGVTVQLIVTHVGTGGNVRFKYHVWWKTFKHTDDGDGNSQDDSCPTSTIEAAASGDAGCGITMPYDSWYQLKDMELQKEFGVYVKFNKCAVGAGGSRDLTQELRVRRSVQLGLLCQSLTSGRFTSPTSKTASITSPPRASVSSPTITPTPPSATTTASACPSPPTRRPCPRRRSDPSSPPPASSNLTNPPRRSRR